MESNQFTEQLQELCHIYYKRNQLGLKRNSKRHKYRYLQDVKRSLQVRDNYKSSELYRRILRKQLVPGGTIETLANEAELANARLKYLKDNPIPKRFKDTKLVEINMMLLEAEAAVCKVKVEVMKHTHKYDKKLKTLLKDRWSPTYVCGQVSNIIIYSEQVDEDGDREPTEWIHSQEFKRYSQEFLANKAVDKMLRS